MKKSILVLGLTLIAFTMSAQLVSKKGEPILPQKGDWALGIEANPFLDYIGNFFGKSVSNSSPSFNFLGGNVIVGKYFIDSMTAYRAGIRLGFGSQVMDRVMVDQLPSAPPTPPYPFPAPPAQVENTWSQSQTNIGITAGMEWRKGKTRLQGYYGGEVGIFYSSSTDKFEYGNALNPSGTASLVVDVDPADDFGPTANNIMSSGVSDGGGPARVTERKNGSSFLFGVRGFAGVEYFFLPKISIGGEFGWGLGFSTSGKSVATYESIGNTGTGGGDITGTTDVETPGGSGFVLDTDNRNTFFGSSGALRLTFHF